MNYEIWILIIANCFMLGLAIIFGIFIYPKREISNETKRRPRSFISNAFFREYWYFVMEPLKRRLIIWGVEPNTITTWGLIFSLAAGVAFGFGQSGLGGWFVVLAATCDVYDGLLARARNISLKSGAFYDSVMDRIGEYGIFCGFLWYFRADLEWFVVVIIASMASQLVSYGRSRAEALGFEKRASRGFFTRAERMIVLCVAASFTPIWNVYLPFDYLLKFGLGIICVGSVQTAISRLIGIYREIRRSEVSAET